VQKKPQSVRFRLTKEMVDRFAELTGDHSSLHVDEVFARRTPFRRLVAHGMLPLMFLSQIDFDTAQGNEFILTSLSGRFIAPVFPGDNLVLEVSNIQNNPSDVKQSTLYEFSITRELSGDLITNGNIGLQSVDRKTIEKTTDHSGDNPSVSITPKKFKERAGLFGEFEKGESVSFPIEISFTHLTKLSDLLSLGIKKKSSTIHENIMMGLLASACTSTYVGMFIPGRYATYTELISEWSVGNTDVLSGTFNGQVIFLSESANTIVSKFTIVSGKGNKQLGEGKIKSRVNQPPIKMPAMEEVISESELGLTDRVVLITGASRGIGETIAKMFAAQGANVIVNYYRGMEDAQSIVDEIVKSGGNAVAIQADVTSVDDITHLVKKGNEKFGSIEILVNNAIGHYKAKPFERWTWKEVQEDLDVIVKGAFNCCKAILPDMVKARHGRIVNLSSIYIENPPPGHLGYVAAKSSLMGLTRVLAKEYASYGITVNAVMPGLAETDLTSGISVMDKEVLREGIPMKRHASPLDIAKTVVYLASDWCSYTTGQQFPVTGGKPPFF